MFSLPRDATPVTVNGTTYYKYGGAWYQPFYSAGATTYSIVQNPT